MKIRVIISAIFSALLLTSCGQVAQNTENTAFSETTTTVSKVTTTSKVEETTAEETTTKQTTTTIDVVESKPETSAETTKTTTAKSDSSSIAETTVSSSGKSTTTTSKTVGKVTTSTAKSNSNSNSNTGAEQPAPQQQSPVQEQQEINEVPETTTTAATTTAPVVSEEKPVTTTPQPVVTSTTTTTENVPDQNVEVVYCQEYDADEVADVGFTEYWLDLYDDPYGKDSLIDIGRNLDNDGSDISKAGAVFAWVRAHYDKSNSNCIQFSAATKALCEGVGLDCYWTQYSNWYLHTSTIVNVNGDWYEFDTNAPVFLGGWDSDFTKVFDDYNNPIDAAISLNRFDENNVTSEDEQMRYDEWEIQIKSGIWDKINYV